MTIWNEAKDADIALAMGNDAGAGAGLTAWRNADAAYIAGELIPSDRLLGWNLIEPTYKTKTFGQMSTSHTQDRVSYSRNEGVWKSKHAFQTAQFCFWLMQTTGTPTTENTPVGYNTHILTIATGNTPLWNGIYFARRGITSNVLYYHLMGMLPSDLDIHCSEGIEARAAIQEITVPFSYLLSDASAINAQTPRPEQTIGSKWKTWDNLLSGVSVGHEPTTFTYSGATMEVDVLDIKIHLHRDYKFACPDTTCYPTVGLLLGWDYYVTMDVRPTGDNLYTVNRTKKEDYTGDLDYTCSFVSDATNDSIIFYFDKMYMEPFDEINDYDKWFEGYTIKLVPLGKTSSLAVTGIDNLNNNHYENP